MYTDMYTFMAAQLVFGCPSLSLTNEDNAIKSVVLEGFWLGLSWADLDTIIGVRDDRERAPRGDVLGQL
jgi:hypothetical protein